MKNKTCYKKDCINNKEYMCIHENELIVKDNSCNAFKKSKNYKEGISYSIDWHLCTKEDSQNVVVFHYPFNDKDTPLSIRCCTCGGVDSNLSKERALNLCKLYNFNVIEGKHLLED